MIRDMYKDMPAEKLAFIENFKFKGKTADEWEREAADSRGVDEKGNPLWYSLLSNSIDAVVFAKIIWDEKTKQKIKF